MIPACFDVFHSFLTGFQDSLTCELEIIAVDVDADTGKSQVLRDDGRGAAAHERVQHDAAGRTARGQDAPDQSGRPCRVVRASVTSDRQ